MHAYSTQAHRFSHSMLQYDYYDWAAEAIQGVSGTGTICKLAREQRTCCLIASILGKGKRGEGTTNKSKHD